MTPAHQIVVTVLALLPLLAPPAGAAGTKLFNLPDAPATPRFKVTDRVWPAQAGEAAICLWDDDKLAALSVTIDDNCAGDVPWWLTQAQACQLPLTWFIVSENLGNPKVAIAGKWSLWTNVLAQGQSVESHTVTHWRGFQANGQRPADWKGIDWEYAESIRQIEAGLPNHKIRYLAFAGGPGQTNNDPKVAAKYYLAARGGRGTINPTNRIDYLNVNAMTGANLGNPKAPWADLNNLFNPKESGYRGWAVLIFHFVGKPEMKAHATTFLDFYRQHADELWGERFGDVARYGQERDTATLTVNETTAARIALTLTARMDPQLDNYPLTVKVRLPAGWTTVHATQNEKPISSRVLEHAGQYFALAKVVPDGGQVALVPGK